MIHTLKCPSCAAPLDYDDKDESSVFRCPFCSNAVYVPDSMRRKGGPKVSVTSVNLRPHRVIKAGATLVVVIVGVVVLFVVGMVFAVWSAISNSTRKTEPIVVNVPTPPRDFLPLLTKDGTPTPAPTPGFATTVLKFGGEGIGPGSFTDARSVAVDGDGRIYAADYIGGRVQVFDSAGKFQTQWMVDTKMPLRALAADRRGTVYVVQSGKIWRYEGATGKALGEIPYAEGWGFDDVAVTADGGLVAFFRKMRDDIVRFDASGKVVRVIRNAVSSNSDGPELSMKIAVDGLGNIYALGSTQDTIFKFAPDGRFVTRFGGRGGEPGQLRAPHGIAVDGRGRVYVSDSKGIQVFDSNGRYLDVFKPAPVSFGLLATDRNELLVAARTQILKCVPKEP
jgi:DNA-binding beta-propeller fold protein YncE